MIEYRFVNEKEIKIYNDHSGTLLFRVEKKGLIRKKIFFLDDNDSPVAFIKSGIFGLKWKGEDIDNESNFAIKKKLFSANYEVKSRAGKYTQDVKVANKIQFVDSASLKIGFIINNKRLKSKNSIIVEDSEYLSEVCCCFTALLVILKLKLI